MALLPAPGAAAEPRFSWSLFHLMKSFVGVQHLGIFFIFEVHFSQFLVLSGMKKEFRNP